jgi:transposase
MRAPILKKPATQGGRAALKNTDILAGTKLTMRDIRKMIDCFADGMLAREAARKTGISHVTIYRFYGLLRLRLVESGIWDTPEQFAEKQRRFEEESESWFGWDNLQRVRQANTARHRNVRAHNRALYEAQALYFKYQLVRPDTLVRLILTAARYTGPFNRPMRPVDNRFRFAIEKIRLFAPQRINENNASLVNNIWRIGGTFKTDFHRDIANLLKREARRAKRLSKPKSD